MVRESPDLRAVGARYGRARLMKAAGSSRPAPQAVAHDDPDPGTTPATDLVERQFQPDRPNARWVADITYLRTGGGWLYPRTTSSAWECPTTILAKSSSTAVTPRPPNATADASSINSNASATRSLANHSPNPTPNPPELQPPHRPAVHFDSDLGGLLEWACALGEPTGFGVEGSGSYGQGLVRYLRRHDHKSRPVPEAHLHHLHDRGATTSHTSRLRSATLTLPSRWLCTSR
jgi:hypothetical protein